MSNKTITVNPDLFRFTNNRTTRKKKGGDSNTPKIKVKDTKKNNGNTMSKNRILRHIRLQQNLNYKDLIDAKPSTSPKQNVQDSVLTDFNNSFDESLKYMQSLEKNTPLPTKHNHTLKSQVPTQSMLYHPNIHLSNLVQDFQMPSSPSIHLAEPKWGCMKGGKLPTYRQHCKNLTQKNPPSLPKPILPSFTTPVPILTHTPTVPVSLPSSVSSPVYPSPPQSNPILPSLLPTLSTLPTLFGEGDQKTPTFTPNLPHKNEMYHMKQTMNRVEYNPSKKYPKQQKTIRRTYKVGKDKKKPVVGVLISNKTMRSNITTKKQLLNQTSIDEIRRYLIKNGFIRVGSTAPNDVLRKMHETAMMMCGEIQNHNPDNLLYNFLHNK